jgi:hypothetical protein
MYTPQNEKLPAPEFGVLGHSFEEDVRREEIEVDDAIERRR